MGEVVEAQTELLTREKFERYWPQIAIELDKVPHIWIEWTTKEALYVGVLDGSLDVWATGTPTSITSVVFTRFSDTPAGRVLQCLLAFGRGIQDCLPSLTATLEKIASEAGCYKCEIHGRRGWLKLLHGFKEDFVVMSKQLQHFKVQ